MADLILGIGDIGVSGDTDSTIKTFALGSCVAIMMYNPALNVGGMVHIALSDSAIDLDKAKEKPGHFADTAVPELVKLMKKKDPFFVPQNIIVYLAGGASMMGMKDFFQIGEKNIKVVRKLLTDLGFIIYKEDTGKDFSRTVTQDIATGKVVLSNIRLGKWELR